MTYFCPKCVVNWYPYQAVNGCCPSCGGGTKRRSEPASKDADVRHLLAGIERARRERLDAFDVYCAERDKARVRAEAA